MKNYEKEKMKAIERSRRNSPKKIKKEKSEKDLERLKQYKIKQLLFLKFDFLEKK